MSEAGYRRNEKRAAGDGLLWHVNAIIETARKTPADEVVRGYITFGAISRRPVHLPDRSSGWGVIRDVSQKRQRDIVVDDDLALMLGAGFDDAVL